MVATKRKGVCFDRNVSHLINNGVSVICLDLFDTFLLRNRKSEIRRFYEVSILHSCLLNRHGYSIETNSLFSARITSHKIGYRTAPLVGGHRDASIDHIFYIYLTYLGIWPDPNLIVRLIDLEIEYEKRNLRLNKDLFDLVVSFHKQGTKIYFITDMYFRSTHLEKLLNYFAGGGERFYTGIYSSCEFSAAKSSGILFRIFLERENINPESVLHIGDNPISDRKKCTECGIKSVYVPRPFFHRLATSIDHWITCYRYRRYLL